MGEMSILLEIAIAFTHLILAARAEGLGTCWIGAFNNDEIKKLLEVPHDYEVVAATPLGYPSEDVFVEAKNRKTLDENSIPVGATVTPTLPQGIAFTICCEEILSANKQSCVY